MKSINKYIALSCLLLGSVTATQKLFGMHNKYFQSIDASPKPSPSFPTTHSKVSLHDLWSDVSALECDVTAQPAATRGKYQEFLYSLFKLNTSYNNQKAAFKKSPKDSEIADKIESLLKSTSEELYYQSTPFFPANFVCPPLPQDFPQKVLQLDSAVNELMAIAEAINTSNAAPQDFSSYNDQIKSCRTLHAEIKNTLETYPEGWKFSKDVREKLVSIEEDICMWENLVNE
jgi:hypothetical protein